MKTLIKVIIIFIITSCHKFEENTLLFKNIHYHIGSKWILQTIYKKEINVLIKPTEYYFKCSRYAKYECLSYTDGEYVIFSVFDIKPLINDTNLSNLKYPYSVSAKIVRLNSKFLIIKFALNGIPYKAYLRK